MEGRNRFQWKRRLATKIDVKFWVENENLNIFHLTIFSKKKKKKQYFRK